MIGLFSLAGLAGAGMAALAGRVADARPPARRHARRRRSASLAGWGLLALGETSLAALLAGIVLFDLGVQATQILNQSVIFRLRPEARSRLNTAYMTCYFAGAVSGSAGASFAWERGGWGAVSAAGAIVAAVGFALTWVRRAPWNGGCERSVRSPSGDARLPALLRRARARAVGSSEPPVTRGTEGDRFGRNLVQRGPSRTRSHGRCGASMGVRYLASL